MAVDYVMGSPEEAEALSRDLIRQVRGIREALNDLGMNLRVMRNCCMDDSYYDMETVVRGVYALTMEAMEPVGEVCKSLNRYGEVLRKFRTLD